MPPDLKSLISLEVVAQELEKAKRPSGGFDSAWYDDLVMCLSVHAPLDSSVAERDRFRICKEAIGQVAQGGVITKQRLLSELGRSSKRFLAQPRRTLVLVTPLSCRYFRQLTRRRFDGWALDFSDGPPRGFDRTFVPDHVWARYGDEHLRLAHVRVSGQARTVHEALETGLERLDFFRGMWNFSMNRWVWAQMGPSENQPLNRLRIGPIHTVHHPDGRPAAEGWWYEPVQERDPFSFDLGREWRKIVPQSKALRAATEGTKIGPELRRLLVRYCRALDGQEHETTILLLWSILEALTASGGADFDTTIRRVRFLFDDEPLVRYLLELFRARRNRLAHLGTGGVDARKAAWQLHRFVAEAMTALFQLAGKFDTLEEFARFLSLPSNVGRLEDEIALRRMAIAYHRETLKGRRLTRS